MATYKRVGQDELSELDGETRKSMESGGKSDWRQIQAKAFTNWANETLRRPLKQSPYKISSLSEMSDGVILVRLLEKLAKKKLPRFNQKPRIKQQKLENLLMVLNFAKSEGIKLVNIGKLK